MTTITVSGAGGNIQSEIFLIADALRKAGYIVSVKDSYFPKEQYDDPTEIEKTRQHCVAFNNGKLFEGREYKCPPMQVLIKADHIPWGG